MRCWYTRWQMSNALERGDLASRMARGHAARCAACQAFGAELASLHDRLSRGAHLAAVPAIVRRPRWVLRVAAPLAAVAAAIAITVGAGVGSGPAEAPVERPVVDVRPLVRMDRVATRLSQVFARSPLETELEALIDDSKRGLDTILATGGLRWPRRTPPPERGR